MSGARGKGTRSELPVDRRVTAGALAAFAEPRSTSGFPIGAVARGVLVSWLTFPAWSFAVLAAFSGFALPAPDRSELELWGIFVVALLIFSVLPAAFLGVPLGAVLVRWLRPVRHPGWHGLAFVVLGAGVGLLALAVFQDSQFIFVIPAAAFASGTGWFAVRRRLVAREPS